MLEPSGIVANNIRTTRSMTKITAKTQRKQLNKKPLEGAQKTSAVKPSKKVSKPKETQQEAHKREEELIESGNTEEILKEVTKVFFPQHTSIYLLPPFHP